MCSLAVLCVQIHWKGSICLLYKPLKVLFSGDHLGKGGSEEPSVTIFEDYNWFSVPEQLNSVKKLLELDFIWLLPGHGRRIEFKDTQEKNSALEDLLASKEQVYGKKVQNKELALKRKKSLVELISLSHNEEEEKNTSFI